MSEDKLDKICLEHRNFSQAIRFNQKVEDKEAETKNLIIATFSELNEILDEINWKWWKQEKFAINREKIGEELTDALCFLIEMFDLWGYKADDIFSMYCSKMKLNYQRFIK